MQLIRLVKSEEKKILTDIWLQSSIQTHSFIPRDYWESKTDVIEHYYLVVGTTYVYEEESVIRGFLTFAGGNFIGGLFVSPCEQRKGIGTALLDFAKEHYYSLELNVYTKNTKAVDFYGNQGFAIVGKATGDDTGEESLRMRWTHGI